MPNTSNKTVHIVTSEEVRGQSPESGANENHDVGQEQAPEQDSVAEGAPETKDQAVLSPVCYPDHMEPIAREALQRICDYRQRSLVVLLDDNLDGGTPHELYRWRNMLSTLSTKGPIDVLIESPGGSLSASYRIARLLGRYVNNWVALVPTMAASGATLICLGSSEVVLSPIAQLGPVDPQVISRRSGKFFMRSDNRP